MCQRGRGLPHTIDRRRAKLCHLLYPGPVKAPTHLIRCCIRLCAYSNSNPRPVADVWICVDAVASSGVNVLPLTAVYVH